MSYCSDLLLEKKMASGDVELSNTVDNNTNENIPQEANPKRKSSRRPDIDIIRIILTWGILLYHTVLIYTPYLSYYVRYSSF